MIEFLLGLGGKEFALFFASALMLIASLYDWFKNKDKAEALGWFLLSSFAFAGGVLLCTQ